MKSAIDMQEAEEFISKVEQVEHLIKKIVNDEPVDPKEIEKVEKKLKSEKENENQKKLIQHQEEQDKLKRGRSGRGEKETYKWYCVKCQVEYVIDLPACSHCNSGLTSCADRLAFLQEKVEELKQKKQLKQERKAKWELWQKTQAIYRTRNSIDVSKWDYFTDSEDSDEEIIKNLPPSLPENNPQFKAMEADLEERARRQKQDRIAAERLKNEGNEFFKKGDFFNAIEKYSQAIDFDRSNKYLWLNRALARTKFGQLEEAIDDCTKMIEYCEVLEDGFMKSKDAALKAFLRRAQALKLIGDYDKALNDCQELKKILNGESDKEVEQLINEVERLKSEKMILEKVKESEKKYPSIEQLKACDQFEKFCFNSLWQEIKASKSIEVAFINDDTALSKIKDFLAREDSAKLLAANYASNVKMSMMDFLLEMNVFSETFAERFVSKNIAFQLKTILRRLLENLGSISIEEFVFVEQILDLFGRFCEKQNGREYFLRSYRYVVECLKTFPPFDLKKFEASALFFDFIGLTTNLFYDEKANSNVRHLKHAYFDHMKTQLFDVVKSLSLSKDPKSIQFAGTLFSNITNLITNSELRTAFFLMAKTNPNQILVPIGLIGKKIDSAEKNPFSVVLRESILNFLINLSFETDPNDFKKIFSDGKVVEFAIRSHDEFRKNSQKEAALKAVSFLSKVDLEDSTIVSKIIKTLIDDENGKSKNDFIPNTSIKFIVNTMRVISAEDLAALFGLDSNIIAKIAHLINNQSEDQLVLYNNTLLLATHLVEANLLYAKVFSNTIEKLIFVIKERTGVLRKTAASLLAKMCQDKDVLAQARELHSTEVLLNLSNILLGK